MKTGMQRKIALLSGIVFFTLLSWSQVARATDSPFNGVYLGGQLGFVYTLFQHNSNAELDVVTTGATNVFLPVNVDDSASNIGPDIGLHIGYGHVFKRVYLGAEINGDLLTAYVNSHSIPKNGWADAYSTSFFTGRISNTYGIDFRPGFLLSPTSMLYLKGGVQRSHVKGTVTTEFTELPEDLIGKLPPFISSSLSGPSVNKLSASGNVWGWQTGIGYEKRAGKHFSFRVEDLISGYGSVDANELKVVTPSMPFLRRISLHHNADMSIKPYTNVFAISANYYF